MMAEFVALNDLLPIMRPSEQICEMLPLLGQHNVLIGSSPAKPAVTDKNVTILLNGQFIPVLSAHFLGRDVIVSKVTLDLHVISLSRADPNPCVVGDSDQISADSRSSSL